MFANPCAQKLANSNNLAGCNVRTILECDVIRQAEDIKEDGMGYEGFVLSGAREKAKTDPSAQPNKRRVTFYVTKGKGGRLVFTFLTMDPTIANV